MKLLQTKELLLWQTIHPWYTKDFITISAPKGVNKCLHSCCYLRFFSFQITSLLLFAHLNCLHSFHFLQIVCWCFLCTYLYMHMYIFLSLITALSCIFLSILFLITAQHYFFCAVLCFIFVYIYINMHAPTDLNLNLSQLHVTSVIR